MSKEEAIDKITTFTGGRAKRPEEDLVYHQEHQELIYRTSY